MSCTIENTWKLNITPTLHIRVKNTQENEINTMRLVKNEKQSGVNPFSQGDVLVRPERGGLAVRGTFWYVLEILA